MPLERVYDLAFEVLPDGGVELEQGFTEVNRVSLHACHVRVLLERCGHLLPPPPADELSKNLAAQLCMLMDGLKDELGRSPGIDNLFFQAATAVDMIPDAAWPHWLYDSERSNQAPSETKSKPAKIARPDFQLHP